MKKYLILVKHSLPEIVKSLPAREWKLSEVGKERARKLADRLHEYQPEAIFSSIEPRAIETAEIIAEKIDLPVYVIEGLHEHERNNVPFLSRYEFLKSMQELFNRPTELVYGNETAEQAYDRFSQAVNSIHTYHKEETVAVVAHGTVISLFVSRLTGVHDFSLWNELGLPSYVVLDMQFNKLIEKKNIA